MYFFCPSNHINLSYQLKGNSKAPETQQGLVQMILPFWDSFRSPLPNVTVDGRNPAITSWGWGSLSHYLQGVIHTSQVVIAGFLNHQQYVCYVNFWECTSTNPFKPTAWNSKSTSMATAPPCLKGKKDANPLPGTTGSTGRVPPYGFTHRFMRKYQLASQIRVSISSLKSLMLAKKSFFKYNLQNNVCSYYPKSCGGVTE